MTKVNRLNVGVNGTDNFIDLMITQAKKYADKTLYTFLKDGEEEVDKLSYAELDLCAKQVGAGLQQELAVGSRVILLFPAGLEFLRAFFGCLYAGMIAIPLPVPTAKASSLNAIENIIENASVAAIITLPSIMKHLDLSRLNNIKLFDLEKVNFSKEFTWQPVFISKDDIAFLQYTSGSTGSPKGVMVSHGNLLHNEYLIKSSFNATEKSVFVSWLPHYHDMGLIGNLLQPVYSGSSLITMSPMAFLQKPLRWLQAISKYQATISGAPNFAYELCANKVTEEQKRELDLSYWRVAFNGAEKVRPETLDKFVRIFADTGFSKKSLFPTYGLAESTVFVTGGPAQTGPTYLDVSKHALENNRVLVDTFASLPSQRIIAVGQPWFDHCVTIVNPETKCACPKNIVGEIWVKGPSVAQGYWNNPDKTKEDFQAYLNDNENDGPYLRTGDLGFIYDGNLYVTGRVKDLIIINGKNIYPDDVENIAQTTHPSLRVSSSAAFSVDIDDQEQLVLLQEVERTELKKIDLNAVFKEISMNILKALDLRVHTIVLIMPHRLPKTTSGKIQRLKAKKMFLSHELVEFARWNIHEQQQNLKDVARSLEYAA